MIRCWRKARRTVSLTLLVATLALPTPSPADNHDTGLSADDLDNAARAAQTTRDFDGTRDLSVAPPPDYARLEELQRTRDRAAVEHGNQLSSLFATLNDQQNQLADARQRLATGEANLASYEEGETWYEAIDDFFRSNFTSQQTQGTRAQSMIRTANEDIERLEAQVANTQSALGQLTESIQAYNERIDLEMRLADPVQRRAEEADRMANLVEIVTDVETQKAQIGAGQAQFLSQSQALDAAIAEARQLQATGEVDEDYADDLVDRYESEKELIEAAQQEWLANMYAELERHESLRDYYFEQNATDRVGATSTDPVLDEIRQQAIDRGEDPARATGIDREALARTEGSDGQPGSATQYSAGAVNMPRFNSIFDGIDSDSVNEFLYDLQEDELDWYEFSLRMGSYTKGVTRAGVDAVTDLAVLLKELGDTQGEAFEQALEQMFGVDLDVFGDENLRLLARVRDQAYLLWDTDNPEGRRVAQDLQQLVENLTRAAQRRLETQAAQGDVHATLEDVGYVAGTVVGVEEVGLRVAGAALRGTAVLWRTADTASDLAQAGRAANLATDTSRAAGAATDSSRASGAAADGSRASRAGDDATQPFDDTLTLPDGDRTTPFDEDLTVPPPGADTNVTRPFDERLPLPGEGNATLPPPGPNATAPPPGVPPGQDDLGTVVLAGQGARASDDAAGAARGAGSQRRVPRTSDDVVRVETVDADTVILHREGFPPVEAKRIPGAVGASSVVYEVPGRPDLVVKFTKPGSANALDQGGYNVINAIDPDGSAVRVPRNFEHLDATGGPQNGGTVTVQERAPDSFNRATSSHAPDGGMTPAQHRAFRRAMDKLNDEGFVWMDAKHDNYAFELAPSPPAAPGEMRLVIVDPGGIVPMKGLDPDAARRLQRALEDPSRYGYTGGNWRIWQGAVMEGLAKDFDDLIDWEAIRNLTGIDYRSLNPFTEAGVALPYNPKNGVDYPQLANDPPPLEPAAATGRSRTGEVVDSARQALDTGVRAGVAGTALGLDAAANSRAGRLAGRVPTAREDEDDTQAGATGSGGAAAGAASSAGSDTATALVSGGGAPTPIINPIFFAFGPLAEIRESIGIYTHCGPCAPLVIEFNEIIRNNIVLTPELLVRLNLIRAALPACETFYCSAALDEPSALAVVELIRVIAIFGNSPYNPLNPTGEDGSSTGVGNEVRVLRLFGGGFARLDQFSGAANAELPVSGPIGCAQSHYHQPQVASPPLIDCEGNSVTDMRSSGCGFGTVSDVTTLPRNLCQNPAN